ncbi:MAG: hypothetical protein LV480_06975 [Methylacidiphilales bacterium]|nr:hypothetical protein [Candidatus Methylacidiphilales bacterium]
MKYMKERKALFFPRSQVALGNVSCSREISFRANFDSSQNFVECFAGVLGFGNALAMTDGGKLFRHFSRDSDAYGFYGSGIRQTGY